MCDVFKFLSDFIDSVFGGWRGRTALITLSTALVLLLLWGLEQTHSPRAVLEGYGRWRWWDSIIPLTVISAILLLTNPRTPRQ